MQYKPKVSTAAGLYIYIYTLLHTSLTSEPLWDLVVESDYSFESEIIESSWGPDLCKFS